MLFQFEIEHGNNNAAFLKHAFMDPVGSENCLSVTS